MEEKSETSEKRWHSFVIVMHLDAAKTYWWQQQKHFHTVQLHQGCLQCFDTEFWYVGGIDSIAVWSLPSLGVLAVNNATSIISSCSKIHTGFTFWHCLTQTALQTGHYNECCFVSYTVPTLHKIWLHKNARIWGGQSDDNLVTHTKKWWMYIYIYRMCNISVTAASEILFYI